MDFPLPYISYLYHFHGDRDYFECHEVLEEYWKSEGMNRKTIWVGLIQVAVSYYHYRNQNFNGAIKLMKKALNLLNDFQKELQLLGIHSEEFMHILKTSFDRILRGQPYQAINIPIVDHTLYEICRYYCRFASVDWGNQDVQTPLQISLKHKRPRIITRKSVNKGRHYVSEKIIETS